MIRRAIPQSKRDAMHRLSRQGLSTRTIARKLEVSQSAVSRELRGVDQKLPPRLRDVRKRVQRRIIDGQPCKEIQDEVRRQAGRIDWPIPAPPEDPTRWVRFDCPFCIGNKGNTAAINYDAQWFSCFRRNCQVNFGTLGGSMPINDDELYKLLNHFKDQINRAVGRVGRKFGNWLDKREIISKAAELMWTYAYRPYGGPNDAGMLWDWEDLAMKQRDPDLLSAYVFRALFGDLMNWADAITAWKRRHSEREILLSPLETTNRESGFQQENSDLDAMIAKAFGSRPREVVLAADSLGDMTREAFGVVESGQALGGTPGGCQRYRNGSGPMKGHCPHCDAQLRSTGRRLPLDTWLRQRGGISHWYWVRKPLSGPGLSWVVGALEPTTAQRYASIQAPDKADRALNSNPPADQE